MAKGDNKDLLKFLKPFPTEVREIALWLREFVWDLYPDANELIYDGYNALAFGWSVTDRQGCIFSNIAIGRSSYNVHFGFYWGSKIADPKKMLIGQGSQYRYILVKNKKEFPAAYMKKLLKDAYVYSLGKLKPDTDKTKIPKGTTTVKLIMKKKRPVAKRLAKKKK